MDKYYIDISKENFNMMGPNTLRLLDELLEDITVQSENQRILDLGCGKALNSLYLAKEKKAIVYSVDLWISAEENFQSAKAWSMENRILPFHVDANQLPFSKEYFDGIVCIDAYHYFGMSPEFFGEKILPLVKAGGFIAIVVPGLKEIPSGRPMELLKEWLGDEIDSFQTVEVWDKILGDSPEIESKEVKEMKAMEEPWEDWFSTGHEYAIHDRQLLEAGLYDYVDFISMIIRKKK